MMETAFKEAERIRDELAQVERAVSNARRDWDKFVVTADDAYLKAVAYDLHGFYTGLERIFQSVADTIDDKLPVGENWHKALLLQMTEEIKNVRPALIANESAIILEEYLRFRHRIRNIYAFNWIPERVKGLMERLPNVFHQLKSNLEDFAEFLEKSSKIEK